jgi:regulation of enolase protein 1 (concanavalin A-like superfamily)
MSEHAGVLPFPLRWHNQPAAPPVLGTSSLTIAAGPKSDLFADPKGDRPVLDAPLALGDPFDDFQLVARVSATFAATYDAAALMVWGAEQVWAKLALELSPQGEPTIVTVVTRGLSDDCNSFAVPGGEAWLRVSRIAETFAFHASLDGRRWWLARYFELPNASYASVGFLAQSPTGEGTQARFDDIGWSATTLADIRDGS